MYYIKYFQVFWKVKNDYCMWPSHSTKYQYINEVCTWLLCEMYQKLQTETARGSVRGAHESHL